MTDIECSYLDTHLGWAVLEQVLLKEYSYNNLDYIYNENMKMKLNDKNPTFEAAILNVYRYNSQFKAPRKGFIYGMYFTFTKLRLRYKKQSHFSHPFLLGSEAADMQFD